MHVHISLGLGAYDVHNYVGCGGLHLQSYPTANPVSLTVSSVRHLVCHILQFHVALSQTPLEEPTLQCYADPSWW